MRKIKDTYYYHSYIINYVINKMEMESTKCCELQKKLKHL